MDESSNSPLLRKKLYKSLWDDRYSSLVNDKYVFHCMCRYHALPVPEMYGQYRDGEFHGKEDSLADLILRRNLEKVILKPLRGMRGIGIKMISRDAIFKEGNRLNAEAYEDIANDLRYGHFIVQEVIKQHPELNELTPYSINTIRITTFLEKNGKVEFLAAILRMSSNHSPVDNFKSGGILTGIEMETGKLRKYGLLHPSYGGRLTEHPLTHTKFVDFQIPYWEQIKSTLARAQETFYHLKSIGWDCAVTSDGPVIIEGNIEYGIVATQAEGGGLLTDKNRRLFSQYGLKI